MDSVAVGRDALLPHGEGLGAPFGCLNSARFGIAWGTMGALEDCVARARAYALERRQFGRPLAGFQLVQKKLVDAQTGMWVFGGPAKPSVIHVWDMTSARADGFVTSIRERQSGWRVSGSVEGAMRRRTS